MSSMMAIMYGGSYFPGELRIDLEKLHWSVDDKYFTVLRHTKARTKTIKRWIKEDGE